MGKEDEVKNGKTNGRNKLKRWEIKDAIGKDSTVSILMNLTRKFTLTATTGVVVEKYYIKHLV